MIQQIYSKSKKKSPKKNLFIPRVVSQPPSVFVVDNNTRGFVLISDVTDDWLIGMTNEGFVLRKSKDPELETKNVFQSRRQIHETTG